MYDKESADDGNIEIIVVCLDKSILTDKAKKNERFILMQKDLLQYITSLVINS